MNLLALSLAFVATTTLALAVSGRGPRGQGGGQLPASAAVPAFPPRPIAYPSDTGPLDSRGPKITSAQRKANRSLLREYAEALGWPTLPDFLDVTAAGETNWNILAHAPGATPTNNYGRGPFGIRPASIYKPPMTGMPQNAVYDPRVSVALAADLAWRLGQAKYWPRGRASADWMAIRRGFRAWPFVADVTWSRPGAAAMRRRIQAAEERAGYTLTGKPAYPNGYQWPGLAWGLARLGVML